MSTSEGGDATTGDEHGDEIFPWYHESRLGKRTDEIRIPVRENETLSFGERETAREIMHSMCDRPCGPDCPEPLRPLGLARFGFDGEPPEGWASEPRRRAAESRLNLEIEEGEPETRFPWGVVILFVILVGLILACTVGGAWFVLSRLHLS